MPHFTAGSRRMVLALLIGPFLYSPTHTIAAAPDADLLSTWVALDAPTGHEQHATGPLAARLGGWTADRAGNLVKTVGSEPGTTVVACLLDAQSFTISQVREDGFLRLHAVGRLPVHPLWAQAHEGQQLRILTREGPVLGVTALANGHFMNLHRDEAITRVDDLWLDVGATSPDDVAAMGIELLDPVIRHLPAWSFAGWTAGPAAGARAGCATVVAAAEAEVSAGGTTRYVLSAASRFSRIGLSAATAMIDDLERVILLGPGADAAEMGTTQDSAHTGGFPIFDSSLLTLLTPEVESAGALMERMHESEAERLAHRLLEAMGVEDQPLDWQAAPAPAPARNDDPAWPGLHDISAEATDFARLLGALGELYGVSEFETPVRDHVLAALPSWARKLAETDDLGNLWVDTGPADAAATVFMAHTDEVGWKIESMQEDGRVELKRQGGALGVAREGQPAVLQISSGTGAKASGKPLMLRGVFLSRNEPEQRWPEHVQAWFGLDQAALAAAGVTAGMPVTGYKEAHRLGQHRFTVRGMDDRVGTAALLAAVQSLDPAALRGRVVFAWSVQEETGLHGARAMARRLGPQTRRVYSIDTFVTSDTPLESPHFAYAPLGDGPVLRSMESTGLVRRAELDRNRAVAAGAGINVQLGMTQGGTDGTVFTFYGVPNAGLSWPGRYSHGPAELGDLRDMVKLVDLIKAFALAPP